MKKIIGVIMLIFFLGQVILAQKILTKNQRMQWWREARFGMFIHWGVYSVPAGSWDGRQIGGIGEWIMNRAKIPVAEYQTMAKVSKVMTITTKPRKH